MRDTRRLVVATSLSGSAVSFSLTETKKEGGSERMNSYNEDDAGQL